MTFSDRIVVTNWNVSCRVGHSAAERAYPQLILVSMEITTPLRRAGQSDRLAHTVDYDVVLKQLRARLVSRTYNLLETVAEDAAALLLRIVGVRAVRVRVTKKIYADAEAVGVEIFREKTAER